MMMRWLVVLFCTSYVKYVNNSGHKRNFSFPMKPPFPWVPSKAIFQQPNTLVVGHDEGWFRFPCKTIHTCTQKTNKRDTVFVGTGIAVESRYTLKTWRWQKARLRPIPNPAPHDPSNECLKFYTKTSPRSIHVGRQHNPATHSSFT